MLTAISPVIVADSNLHGLAMAFWRCWIFFAVLALIILIRKDKNLTFKRFLSAAPAGICFGSSMGLFFWAAKITSILNATLITILLPIPLTIASFFIFRERINLRHIIVSIIAVCGAMLIVASGSSSGTGDIKGDLLAAVGVLISAGYFVFGKRTLLTVPLFEFVAGVFAWGGLVLIPMVIATQASIIAQSNADVGRIFMVALIPGVGHFLLNYSQGKAPLNLIAVFQLIVPVVSTLLAYWILSQTVSVFQGVGMAIVLIMLGINSYFKPSDEETSQVE
tara:strand:- start:409 stop:1245 length:837 start_codon:yes stop_codon:yes gene_type:complete